MKWAFAVPLALAMMLGMMLATPDLKELSRMQARFAKVDLAPDVTRLSDGDKQALIKLVQAARLIDDLFLQQYWSKNRETLASLRQDKSA
ncbi:MAG: hypothetical protein H7039_10755, partial [Bryobacteraceae bacterium]|nr:hypothetical protein [Bryobacteraceae bacterium]